MRDAGSDDLRTSVLTGLRLLFGWACAAVAVLNLSMGAASTTYLLFHGVLLAGGVSLLTIDKLPHRPKPFGYAVTCALAVLLTVITAFPRTSGVCCMTGLALRHGFPLTFLASDPGRPRHFAAGHAVADLVFWVLTGLIILIIVTLVRPRRAPVTRPVRRSTYTPTHAEDRAAPASAPAAPDDENVRGLP
jgi:hypothetical protein